MSPETDQFDHSQPVKLPPEHIEAASHERRIIVQYDGCDPPHLLGMDIDKWLEYRFDYIDEGNTQIDAIYWDIGFGSEAVWPSKVIPVTTRGGIPKWLDAGIDWVGLLVEECRKRGLETFWHHRISEVDGDEERAGHGLKKLSPMKAKHQDWTLKTWWWQGLWNLTVPELREHKVMFLRELAEMYDFDGFQVDFARHIPCLPVGRQWELRGHATEFMRMLRLALMDVAEKRGKPILLSAKVPRSPEGCRIDGFDVETWIRLNLVDRLTLGSRSMDVDVEAFRAMPGCDRIKLYPCLDDHHSTDGYHFPSIEFFRGVFGNWWDQRADGVVTFNWACARPEVRKKVGGGWRGPDSQRIAYHECGNPETLKGKDKMFAVERRGGYPYAEGFFNQNATAPLPDTLAYDGRPSEFNIRICDDPKDKAASIRDVTLHITVFDARPGDKIGVSVNGTPLESEEYDFDWKDPQIFSPGKQPVSGYVIPEINPEQRLLRVSFKVAPSLCRKGRNLVEICSLERAPHILCPLQVEKIELHTSYGDSR